ncbi:type IV secretory system conjugative DNA transfer family protein [Azoarcus indigens]|uniref:Type IV secretion system protein VirD4 n=1 Tax=Azoarcus indigens TaxID=29545 RepID=A0A4R6E0K7_9RHOO|nr:type IV secretory system conjugative DNA transfer family protein [Azoarcus indigens]TDN50764.1 type IV secretion system protein VirD4 [Azoarcus indigens]
MNGLHLFIELPVFLGGLALIVFLAYRKQAGGGEGFGQFAGSYAKKSWKWLLPGFIAGVLIGPISGFVVLAISYGISRIDFGAEKRKRQQAREAVLKEHEKWIQELGASQAQRTAAINEMFDRKDRAVSISIWHEFADKSANGTKSESFLEFHISRHLAAMETREREMLRVTELLLNAVEGAPSEQDMKWYRWAKFGLIWGNGKATIDHYSYSMWAEDKGIRDAGGAINWFMSKEGASADAVVSNVLKVMQSKEGDPAVQPLIKEASARLKGGNAWLSPDALADTIFAPNGRPGLKIGTVDGEPLIYSGEGSLITVAPPGSGKTQCNVFPNLLDWHGPAVVLDVKGEIYAGTSKWRAENVGPVFKFSPLDPANSHFYNPLAFIRQESDYIWEDARFLADMMIVPSGAADPFWENKARDVLTAAVAYVAYSNPPESRPMSQIIDIIHGGKPWDEMVLGLQAAVDVRSMMQQGTSLAGMNEKTRDSVLQTAQSSLSAWSGERIARATSRSDWSPLDLRGAANPTVYICLKPSEVDSYISLLRVIIAQHIRMLCSELPPRGAAPILFLLDELPRLKHMPPVEEAIEIGRQYGLRLWLFAQSLGQLEKAYPNAEGMVGSCAVRIFMNPTAHDGLAEKLSEQLGYRESIMDGSRQRLVDAAELAGPAYRDYQIVMAASCKPAKVRKDFAWQNPEVAGRMGSL